MTSTAQDDSNTDTFDYIVTGAGSAAASSRRGSARRPATRVAARGGRQRQQSLDPRADGYPKVFANPRFNWMYESEPEPG